MRGKDLWIDEANGVLMARAGVGALMQHLKLDSSPPLYCLLLGGWMRLFGDSEAAVRSLSIIPGVLLVGALLAIGRRLFSLETGIVAAVIAAVAPIAVFYSQQARMYSLLALLGLLSSYWLWRAIEDGRKRYFAGYVAATLAALYTHNFALHLLPAHLVILAWSGALRRRPWTWVLCGATLFVGFIPWLPTFLTQLANKSQYAWFADSWREWGVWGSVRNTLISFAPGDTHPFFTFARPPALRWTPVVLFALTAALGLLRVVRRGPRGVQPNRATIWLLCALVLPLASAAATSSISTPNYVYGRVDQLVFGPFVLLVALGLTTLRSALRPMLGGAPAYALLLAFLFYSCGGLAHLYGNQLDNGERALARRIARRAQPGDAVLCTSLTRAPVEYYLNRMDVPVRLFSYPRDTARHMGNQNHEALLAHPEQLEQEIRAVEEEIATACGRENRVFAVLAFHPVNRRLAAHLSAQKKEGRIEELGEFRQAGGKGAMVLCLRRPTAASGPH